MSEYGGYGVDDEGENPYGTPPPPPGYGQVPPPPGYGQVPLGYGTPAAPGYGQMPPPPGYGQNGPVNYGGNYDPRQYGGFGGVVGGGTKPDNYLVWAILTTIFCCLPFGIVSIVNAAKVDSLWAQGDTQGSLLAAAAAQRWAKISVGAWGVLIILYILLIVVVGVGSSSGT